MASPETSPVLRRMLAHSAAPAMGGVDTPFKALSSAVERLSDRAFSLPLVVNGITREDQPRDALMAGFEAPVLMLRLVGTTGAVGMAGICPDLRSALIEIQTTGTVGRSPASDRAATDVDVAICLRFVEQILHECQTASEAGPAAFCATKFAVNGRFTGVRALTLALEDVSFAKVVLRFDLGNGARQGMLSLLIPQLAPKSSGGGGNQWQEAMSRAVDDATVPMRAVLHRKVLSLSDVEALEVGAVLRLPRAAASAIVLETSEKRIGNFKLGQVSGQKAVRRVADTVPAQDHPPVDNREPDESLALSDPEPDEQETQAEADAPEPMDTA